VFLAWHIVTSVLPRYALEFGITTIEVGLLLSAFTLGRILCNFPAGTLAERVGRRRVLIAGGVLVGLASLGSGLAQSFPQLVAMRFLTGCGGALAIVAQMTMLADMTTRQNRARVMGMSEGVITAGLFLGPGVGGLIADLAGLRVPFYLAAVLITLLTVWAAVRLPETGSWMLDAPAGSPDAESAPREPPPRLLAAVRIILSSREYCLITLLGFATFFTRFATLFFMLPLLGYVRLGMTPGEYGLMASGIALAHVPLLLVSTMLVERFGRKAVIVPTNLLTGVAVIAYGLAPTREWFYAAACLYALASGIGGPAPIAYLADVVQPSLRGMSMGLYRTFGDMAGFVGPLILGVLAGLWTHGGAVIANGLVVCALAVVFGLFAHETASRRSPA
jgi:MFS family permease